MGNKHYPSWEWLDIDTDRHKTCHCRENTGGWVGERRRWDERRSEEMKGMDREEEGTENIKRCFNMYEE